MRGCSSLPCSHTSTIPRRESEGEGEREKRVEYELIAMKIYSMICIKMLINMNIRMNINIFHVCERKGDMVLISRLGPPLSTYLPFFEPTQG